jgi:uncharacterized protein YbjT (DUF2867 family)
MTENKNTQTESTTKPTTESTSPLTLVLGGTGKTGSRVADRLAKHGVPVRIGSRSAERPFDWENPETWAAALDGVERVYVSFQPDVAVPGATDTIAAFTEAARTAGVRRLVLLSGRGEPEAQSCEQIVQQSGLEWTVVRASWFAQNFSEGAMLEPVLSGVVALPVGDVGEPFVDADDIADVAVAALTAPSGDAHVGQVFEVTGPRLLTFAEAVAEIARATGREIQYVPVTIEEYSAALAEAQLPPEVIELLAYLFAEVLDGRNAHTADGVRRALGREPRDFADFARAAAADTAGAWSAR